METETIGSPGFTVRTSPRVTVEVVPYLVSLVAVAAAVLALGALAASLRAPVRRLAFARTGVAGDLTDRVGVLAARLAATRARRAQRHDDAPTIVMARSDRGSTL